MARRLALPVLVAVVALSACGGGDDADGPGRAAAPATTETDAAAPAREGTFLPEPVYARCGTGALERKAKPLIDDQTGASAGWQVDYSYPAAAPRPPLPEEIRAISLNERPPVGRRGFLEGGREIVTAGRRLSYAEQKEPLTRIAQFKTRSARFVAIVHGGSRRAFERFIACLP